MQGGSIGYRQREGYSVEEIVRSTALGGRPGSGSESRPGDKRGKGSDRRRREEVSRGVSEESTEALSEARSAEALSEARSAEASFADGSSDSSGGSSSEGSSDTSSGSFGDSAWDCVWCRADHSGQATVSQICPKHELLHSLALQELAIAHLFQAEAENARAVASQSVAPLSPDELAAFQHSVAKVLELAVETEKLLLTKLRLLLSKSGATRSDSGRGKGDAPGA